MEARQRQANPSNLERWTHYESAEPPLGPSVLSLDQFLVLDIIPPLTTPVA
jgi:hypothetical protein